MFKINSAFSFIFLFILFAGSVTPLWAYDAPKEDKLNVAVIILDGLRKDAMDKLLEDGKLPNLQYLIETGANVKNGMTVLPSTTGPAYVPFVMGLYPWKSLIPGIRWYNRNDGTYRAYCGTDAAKWNEDLPKKFPTIYELLPSEESISVFGFITRGCKNTGMPLFKLMMAKIQNNNYKLDNALFGEFKNLYEKKRPRFAFLSLHGADSYGHSKGAESYDYFNSIVNYDRILGKVINLYKNAGEFDSTVFVISSDHGQRTVKKGSGLKETFKSKGLDVQDSIGRSTFLFNARKSRHLKKHDCVLAVSGNSCVQLYFKDRASDKGDKETLTKRPEYSTLRSYPVVDDKGKSSNIDLVEVLTNHVAVGLVFIKDNSKYHIFSKDGHSTIDAKGLSYSYNLLSGIDPLGYSTYAETQELLGNKFHHPDVWLAATADSEYPDAIQQIVQLLDTPGSGDIIINSNKDYEPWNEGQRGVHGGATREEMVVPIVISGPSIAQTEIYCARTVDIFPTILKILDIETPEGIDGKELPIFK